MRRLCLWGLGIVIVLAIVAFTAGPWFYREYIAGEADAELTLPGQTEAATTDVNGTWTVVPGPDDDTAHTSGLPRRRDPARLPLTVNGRTPKITGEAVVAGSKLK